jgi:hypothetical protein
MPDLLDHVHVDQRVFLGLGVQVVQPFAVAQAHVTDVAQPVVHQPHPRATQGRTHTAAAVVAHHHDVLHLEVIHGELDHRQRIQVRGHHHVGHVAVHEHFARLQPGDLVGRHPAVRAADPQVFGCLLLRQVAEEVGALLHHLGGPGAVVVDEELDIGGHARMVAKGRPRRGRQDARPKVGAGLTSSRRTARGRSACGGSRWCRRRSRTAWHRATGGPAGTR